MFIVRHHKYLRVLLFLLAISIGVLCEKKVEEKKVWEKIDIPIKKPSNPSDLSNPENAARSAKIITSILRMFVSSFNTAMNQLVPALVFFDQVFKSTGTQIGSEIKIPPPGEKLDAPCEGGGAFDSKIRNQDKKTKIIEITFKDCKGDFGREDQSAEARGRISFEMEDTNFEGNSPDEEGWFPNTISGNFEEIVFRLKQKDSEAELRADFHMLATGSFFSPSTDQAQEAQNLPALQEVSMDSLMNGTISVKGFFIRKNKKVAFDYRIFFDGVRFVVSGVMEGITVSGGWRMIDNIDLTNSFEAVFQNVTLGLKMDGNIWSESVSSGSLIFSECLGGKVEIKTLKEISLNFPECPTSGVLEVVSGSQQVSVTFTDKGGIDIDIGMDGNIEKSFPYCESAEFSACGFY